MRKIKSRAEALDRKDDMIFFISLAAATTGLAMVYLLILMLPSIL